MDIDWQAGIVALVIGCPIIALYVHGIYKGTKPPEGA